MDIITMGHFCRTIVKDNSSCLFYYSDFELTLFNTSYVTPYNTSTFPTLVSSSLSPIAPLFSLNVSTSTPAPSAPSSASVKSRLSNSIERVTITPEHSKASTEKSTDVLTTRKQSLNSSFKSTSEPVSFSSLNFPVTSHNLNSVKSSISVLSSQSPSTVTLPAFTLSSPIPVSMSNSKFPFASVPKTTPKPVDDLHVSFPAHRASSAHDLESSSTTPPAAKSKTNDAAFSVSTNLKHLKPTSSVSFTTKPPAKPIDGLFFTADTIRIASPTQKPIQSGKSIVFPSTKPSNSKDKNYNYKTGIGHWPIATPPWKRYDSYFH
ncbi:hypothetical protein EB796_021193 [Bugula neritina]|uniref:Uncharacterized protein n=1 Tax=Bugula neritina TaxID=10212 RepID=A0A7J7J326_BUGNE|nr:hypothetical protein EB796_021193 [Bugula neritina]